MSKLKAASMVNNIALVRQRLGDARLGELLAPLPEDTRALFSRRLLSVEWIDADIWMPFQNALYERHFGGDEESYRALVRDVCALDFNTVYQFLIRLASPVFILEKAAKVWRTYVDSGSIRVAGGRREDERYEVAIALRDAPRHLLFAVITHGFIEQLLGMTGAKDVFVERKKCELTELGLDVDYRVTYR